MRAMPPVAAAALVRALSRQFSHAFITLDSQHSTSFSDSMACAAVGANMEAFAARFQTDAIELLVAEAHWLLKLGPRLTKSKSRVRHFAGAAVSPYKIAAVLQRCSRWLDLVPRWAGQRLLFASDDFLL